MLIARAFEPRTYQALEFLIENGLPVQLLKVAFYADDDGRRFINVEWESEPETTLTVETEAEIAEGHPDAGGALDFREVTLADVAERVGTPRDLVWTRPRKGERHEATLLDNGRIKLADGQEFRSPSGAAMAAAQVVSYDGWYAWRIGEGGPTLDDLRRQIAQEQSAAGSEGPAAVTAQDDAPPIAEQSDSLPTEMSR